MEFSFIWYMDWVVRFPITARFFLSPKRSDWLWGPTDISVEWTIRTGSSGVKRPGHEADHSSPFSAEVKNTSTPHTSLHDVVLN
jgi:hypothetical protein